MYLCSVCCCGNVCIFVFVCEGGVHVRTCVCVCACVHMRPHAHSRTCVRTHIQMLVHVSVFFFDSHFFLHFFYMIVTAFMCLLAILNALARSECI